MDINSVVLLGRLTRDAELRYTGAGYPVCNFSLAVNRKRKNGDVWEDEASFFDVVLWGKQGEALNQYLVKGKQVCIQGELRQNRWEQDGQSRSRVEIIATNLQLLGGGAYSGGQQSNYTGPVDSGYQNRQKKAPEDNYDSGYDSSDLDNIPF